MLNLIKTEVPATPEQDFTLESDVWMDGKLRVSRGATHDTYFLFHENQEVPNSQMLEGEEGETPDEPTTRQAVMAWPVVVKKPATYENVVNAAERVAYNLNSDAEAISFTASLARRFRLNNQDAESKEHDEFMNKVLQEVKPLFQ